MRLAYILVVLAVVFVAIAVIAISFENAQSNQPPRILIAYQGYSYSGVLESYCWPNPPANGTCPLRIDAQRTNIHPPIPVPQNSSVTFQVVGYPSQTTFTVSIWTRNGGGSTVIAIKHITNSLLIDLPAGNYYLSAFSSWSDKRAVSYTYEISVST